MAAKNDRKTTDNYNLMESYNLLFLSGGRTRCDPTWNKPPTGIDQCLKFYYLVGGEASVRIDGQDVRLIHNRLYFINGYRLERQQCDGMMDHYWIHFVPQNLSFANMLRRLPPFRAVKFPGRSFWMPVWREVPLLFRPEKSDHRHPAPPRTTPPPDRSCRIEAMLLYFVGELLTEFKVPVNEGPTRDELRLQPAVEFMDRKYLDTPPLSEVARTVHLAPPYFHSLFTRTFGLTPRRYMLEKRMNRARRLLFTTRLTVKEVARDCGYPNEFHFSRTFRKHFGMSPAQFRGGAKRVIAESEESRPCE